MAKPKKETEVKGIDENNELSEDMQKKMVKSPRPQTLPSMEDEGNLELEKKALEVQDIDDSTKAFKKRRSALTEEMLAIMKKGNMTTYQHNGFLIEREEKGENIKIKSVKSDDE